MHLQLSDYWRLTFECAGVCEREGFPGGQVVKNPPAKQEMWVRSLGSRRSPGEGNGNPLQYSCLENPHG